jgi:hypothetical protein
MITFNKKGQEILSGIAMILFLVLIITAILPFNQYMLTSARGSDNLDCTNESITTGQRATCVLFDFYFVYWAIVVMGAGAAYLFGKQYV